MPSQKLVRPHITAFLDPWRSGRVEELRERWDPVMAGQIAAHLTLIYPEEVPVGADPWQLAVTAAACTPPFTIALGPAFYEGSPAGGVFLSVCDVDGGIAAFRAAAIPPSGMIDFPLHVTIVHPRTSDCGRQAWNELAGAIIDAKFTIAQVAVTAFSGDRWQTVQSLSLNVSRDGAQQCATD